MTKQREIKFKNFKKNNIIKRAIGKPKFVEVDDFGREIKFRAWDKTKKKWFEGEWGILINSKIIDGKFDIDLNKRFILMQYTGLKDTNKNDIYAGDILQYISSINKQKEIAEVFWNNKYSSFEVRGDIASCYNKNLGVFINRLSNKPRWEVIGNIYENPNLLESEVK